VAIISRSVFEASAPAGVTLGHVLPIDRYTSSPAAFEALGSDDAIFLVTVLPPSETPWLEAVLESPKKEGAAWVASPNRTPISDLSAAIPLLKLASGKGIAPKPGRLAMSLQTPRILADADVALLRGQAPLAATAVLAYRAQVSVMPATERAKEEATEVARTDPGRFSFVNLRRPFTDLASFPRPQYAQLAALTQQEALGATSKPAVSSGTPSSRRPSGTVCSPPSLPTSAPRSRLRVRTFLASAPASLSSACRPTHVSRAGLASHPPRCWKPQWAAGRADLVPNEAVARGMVGDMARWDNGPQPTAAAIDMIVRVGPVCIPFLEQAIKTSTRKHRDALAKALERLTKPATSPKKKAARSS
jgi:hypothetical protein